MAKIIEESMQKNPSDEEAWQAVKILNNRQLSIWQRLYSEGLSMPAGGPVNVKYDIGSNNTLNSWLVVFLTATGAEQEGYYFKTKDHADVVEKAKLMLETRKAGKKKIDGRACCPLATIHPCVCIISFVCPLHGSKCHGSHD